MSVGRGDPDNPSLAAVVAIGTVVIVALIFVLQAFFNTVTDQMDRERNIEVADTALRQVRAEQQERLAEYRWVSEKDGVVAIPIDRAIEVVAREAAEARKRK